MGLELPKRARRLAYGGAAASAMLLLSGCSDYSKSQLERLAMPIPATREAPHTADLWRWSWLAAILTGIVVWGLIFYVIVAFRRRSDDEVPVQTRYNLPIEIFYTIAPIMMVIVFFFFTVKTQDQVLHNFKQPDERVTVVGQQWSWTFNYIHEPAAGGKTVFDAGTPAEQPTLWLVKDAKTEFHLFSPDVIHSFWVPAFLFKMDVVPGRDNHFGLVPNRAGTYEGKCAELCGVYHSRMLFHVKVVDQAAFDQHMKDLVKAGNVGKNLGNANVRIQPGLENTNGAKQ